MPIITDNLQTGTLSQKNNFCWMRQIEVRLTSRLTKKKIVFGGIDSNQLNIVVKGSKYISALKDNGTVSISNLTYAQIVELIIGQYYEIEIWAGYRTQQLQCFFKGAVSYISDKIQARRDNTCYILFASRMVASYSQQRMNLNLNSGINLYAAFNYICLTNGIDSSHLSNSLKQEFLNEVITNYGTPATLCDQLANNTNNLTIDTDESIDGCGVVDCTNLNDKRYIRINPNTINFTKGNPTLDKDGLHITLLPTFCFKPGDIIIIDNAILDVSISDANSVYSTFKSNYIDSNGAYMIMELNYGLTNRGTEFEINIRARSLSIIANVTGANINL